jgi:hypothetical protein
MDVTLADFQPINTWKPDRDGEKWQDGSPRYLTDMSTGRRYWNESEDIVWGKCLMASVATPFLHPVAVICNIAYRILKLVSLYHFWGVRDEKGRFNFKKSITEVGEDIFKLVVSPFSLIGEAAAIYGLYSPYDGRKLYASIERATYGHFILAPCFQPDPTSHALGGNPNKQNAF